MRLRRRTGNPAEFFMEEIVMADSGFLGYVGAFTGIIGSVLGYVGYRQSGQMKAIDLRLQLGQAENQVRIALEHLPDLMRTAKQSRANVTSFSGQTGALQGWNNSFDEDVRAGAAIAMDLSLVAAGDSATLKAAALAGKVIKLHDLNLKVSRLTEKYKSSIAEDDRAREERRTEIRAKVQ